MNEKAKFDEEMRVLDEEIADAGNTLKQLHAIREKKLKDRHPLIIVDSDDLLNPLPAEWLQQWEEARIMESVLTERYFDAAGDCIFKNKKIIIDPECQQKGIKP